MKNYNEEYYYLEPNGINYPALDFAGPNQIKNKFKFFKEDAIDESVIELQFSAPIPRKPKMADLHSMASNRVISRRLRDLLISLNLKDVQFIPAVITDKNGDLIEDYFIIHIHNIIKCADMEKSIYEDDNDEDAVKLVYDFEKLVLDNKRLDKIPLEERLVFFVDESDLRRLYHRTVAEKILSLKPTGVAFYQLSSYDPSRPFQEEFIDWILDDED